MSRLACRGCKLLVPVVDQEGYCQECAADLPVPSEVQAMAYLLASIPYKEGDRVECRTAGEIFDGVGTVKDISFDVERGGGTAVLPAFLVEIDEPANEHSPAEGWYHEVCLKPAKVKVDR